MGRKNLKAKLAFLVLILSLFIIFSSDLYSQEEKIRIVKKDAFLRLEPNNESEILRELPMGSEFLVEEILDEWVKIKLPVDENGIVILGYVHKSFLQLSPTRTPKAIIQTKPPLEKPRPIPSNKEPERISSPEINENYLDWKKKLELAKTKLKTGNTIELIGSIISGFSLGLQLIQANSNYYYDSTPYTIVSGVGVISAIVGFAMSAPAKKEVKQLELEGARKGYILASINAIPKGFSLSLAFSF